MSKSGFVNIVLILTPFLASATAKELDKNISSAWFTEDGKEVVVGSRIAWLLGPPATVLLPKTLSNRNTGISYQENEIDETHQENMSYLSRHSKLIRDFRRL